MSAKMGRPFSENPRRIRIETRMTNDELAKLDFCCKKIEKSRSEVIRNAIDKLCMELKSI